MEKIKLYQIKNKIFWLLPLISTAIFYILINFINILLFKINIINSISIIIDFSMICYISYLFFAFSKKTYIFFILQFIIMASIYVGSSIKVSFFGASIISEDLLSIKEMLIAIFMINPLYVVLIILVILLLLSVFIINIKFRKLGLIMLLIGICFSSSISLFEKEYKGLLNNIDKNYLFWNQQENYKHIGPIAYFINQYIRSNNKSDSPSMKLVEESLKSIDKGKIYSSILNDPSQFKDKNKIEDYKKRPNINFILVESLWDPKLINGSEYSQDPFYKGFRELVDKSSSYLVSPTFAGKTADPEFELLCGIPILKNNVPFQTELKNNLPCLPSILSSIGYETNAFHADWSTFYNRDKVYKRIGFDNYYSIKDYKKDDLNDGKMSDNSFLNQSYEFINKEDSKPKFNYYLTISTHIPYSLNESRPRLVSNNMSNGWIDSYSNSIYYTTKEIYEFISKIKRDDPDSIIVIIGDHLPFLGMNDEVYSQTNTKDPLILHSTPLIFINGENNINVGKVNMFRFGEHLLNIFGINKQNTLFGIFDSKELSEVRSLYVDKQSPEYININNGERLYSPPFLSSYLINIYNDLLFGKQHSIK